MASAEHRAALAVQKLVNDITFLPRAFGMSITALPPATQQSVMRAFMGIVEMMAIEYDHDTCYPQNREACRLAFNIREAMIKEFGVFPVPLNYI